MMNHDLWLNWGFTNVVRHPVLLCCCPARSPARLLFTCLHCRLPPTHSLIKPPPSTTTVRCPGPFVNPYCLTGEAIILYSTTWWLSEFTNSCMSKDSNVTHRSFLIMCRLFTFRHGWLLLVGSCKCLERFALLSPPTGADRNCIAISHFQMP